MAKLLIITQKVDINDPVLGFFHRWIEKFSENFERITVICLQKGEYNLPGNVKVLSLGKKDLEIETWKLKIVYKFKYIFNFWRYIWQERKNYDSVLVHMNQIYVILGWKLWKLLGKKILLWRNHPQGNIFTNIAVWVSNVVFCTSRYSYTAKFKKTKLMPAGIDTDLFRLNTRTSANPNSILYVGRISSVKNLELLADVLIELDCRSINFRATIVGEPLPDNLDYYRDLRSKTKNLEDAEKIYFKGGVVNNLLPEIYNQNEVIVNLTPSGSLDKTILEAMACGTVPIVHNPDFKEVLGDLYLDTLNASTLADKIDWVLNHISKFDTNKLREYVVSNHSLDLLTEKIKQFT